MRVWLKMDGWSVERVHEKDPDGVEYVQAKDYDELLEWAKDFSARYACGCGHPACKSCHRDEAFRLLRGEIKE